MKACPRFVLFMIMMIEENCYETSIFCVCHRADGAEPEDGSYAVITTGNSTAARANTEDGKTYTYYNAQGQRCFAYTLYASFTYNGVTSQAVSCEGSAAIYRQGWSLSTHSEYVSGSTAYGQASFTGPDGQVRTVSLTLTCDKNGNVT